MNYNFGERNFGDVVCLFQVQQRGQGFLYEERHFGAVACLFQLKQDSLYNMKFPVNEKKEKAIR